MRHQKRRISNGVFQQKASVLRIKKRQYLLQQQKLDEWKNYAHNLQGQVRYLNQAYENLAAKDKRYKKMILPKILKPLFKIEMAISSLNSYRKKVRTLVKEQGGVKKAYRYIYIYYKNNGLRNTKLFLRSYVASKSVYLNNGYQSRYQIQQPVELIERTKISLTHMAKEVKVICFYLPQFHPFPENDKWWGSGFTEWTNVKPALPQYKEHYQPHVPHKDIGYYSLLDKETQKKQIELAQQYGIEGFCYYLYWFSGKRLMETPLDNMLEDTSLNFPFCVCWANENWSRRWDGLDQDILIAQEYSNDDDINFIEHVSKYLKDKRYIRINGKPLLVIYRPNLFPDMKATVKRWRMWCKDNGIGDIYLAYPQSFEVKNPVEYDFDAAIEFPPNNSNPPVITKEINSVNPDFQGVIYDWRILLERSDNYTYIDYKLFRSATPSWDNTARKKNKGIIFEKSCPKLFEKYLLNAFSETIIQRENSDEKLVFVNAWNEWAEGAHLEPDQKYGYAWLQAVQNAHLMLKAIRDIKFGIVIHAFYPDVLEEILIHLNWAKSFNKNLKLYVTTPFEEEFIVNKILKESGFDYELLPCENKGRDVLPFLKILSSVRRDNVSYFLKIHTKRSLHRHNGELWRQYIYKQLLSKSGVVSALYAFLTKDKLGLISPDNHLLKLSDYLGSNKFLLQAFCQETGIQFNQLKDYDFIAGTMFFARTEVFDYLKNLDLEKINFDEEKGQIDGTLAHVCERYFGILAMEQGYSMEEINITEFQDRLRFV